METKQLKYVLEVSDLGIHYYSAISQEGKVELQVALHKSGLISKISFISINSNNDRKAISKQEFSEALNIVYRSVNEFLKSEEISPIFIE